MMMVFLLQFRAQVDRAARNIERPTPVGEALLLDGDLVTPGGNYHGGRRVANKCTVNFNICAGNT